MTTINLKKRAKNFQTFHCVDRVLIKHRFSQRLGDSFNTLFVAPVNKRKELIVRVCAKVKRNQGIY